MVHENRGQLMFCSCPGDFVGLAILSQPSVKRSHTFVGGRHGR